MSQYSLGDIVNTRTLIAQTLLDMADNDPAIWALTSDCGGNMKSFVEKYPDRFVDTGIAEQNAAGIAAGLALAGGIPYILGMTPFVTMRCFEQNRSAISYQNLPVRIIGWVGGMTSTGGSTHYAMEDISIMRSIANMKVISISDPLMCASVLRSSGNLEGPIFLRLTTAKADPVIYSPGTQSFEIGKSVLAHDGNDAALFVHGGLVQRALTLARELEQEGIHLRVVDMWSIKPLDQRAVLDSIEQIGKIVVWEDHFMSGGLASAIADFIADAGVAPQKFVRIGIPETYPGFGPYDSLLCKYHMDAESVKRIVRQIVS
ncbi:MAG: hypothetical protein HFF50_03125 [Lawsonibacter sp.]|nr:hypothetical protein [Lawsonibacter sp.]